MNSGRHVTVGLSICVMIGLIGGWRTIELQAAGSGKVDRVAEIEAELQRINIRLLAIERHLGMIGDTQAADVDERSLDETVVVLQATMIDKRVQQQHGEQYLFVDFRLDTAALRQPTRAVKGILTFHDLFGDRTLKVKWTAVEQLVPGVPYEARGIGFKFDPNNAEHRWIRDSDIKSVALQFSVQSIIYTDGSKD